jgi:hypothetical protein
LKHPLSAPKTKIQRARKHLAELEFEVAAFIATGPAKFSVESIDENGARKIIWNSEISGPPEEISAIVGDIIHNLRTALDLMACDMVRAAEQSDKDVYFPFSESAEELDYMIRRRHFDRAGVDAVTLLQSLKPYRNGNTPLRIIHDLDVHDKHRALILNVMCVASPIVRMWDDDGTMNPRVIGNPNCPTEIKLAFPGETGSQPRELISTVHELVQLVEGIVEAFRALANRDTLTSDAL